MPARKKPVTRRKAAKNDSRAQQLAQLRKNRQGIAGQARARTRARKIEARVKSEAQKARAQLASQISTLRDQGRKLATNLKSALGDAGKRDAGASAGARQKSRS